MINDALEPDKSKLFVVEDTTDEDPDTAYDLLVTRKRMPIPKEFLDITWGRSSAREDLRLVVERIKVHADGDAPGETAEVTKKFRHFVDHLRVANTVIGRDQLSKKSKSENQLFSLRHWADSGFPE